MTVVGTIEVEVVPTTTAFAPELQAQLSDAAAKVAAANKLTFDQIGTQADTAANKVASSMGQMTVAASGSRTGLTALGTAVEDVGAKSEESGGLLERFSDIAVSGLNHFGSLAGSVLPAAGEAFSQMAEKIEAAEVSSSGFFETLTQIGKVTTVALAAGLAVVAGEAINLGENFQQSTAHLAANAGISVKAATDIGTAFLNTAGTTTISAQTMMNAYSHVAAQLGTTEGHALTAAQALDVTRAAMDLAESSGTQLSTDMGALSGVMQAFQIPAKGAAGAADVLFNVAKTTNTAIDAVATTVERLRSRLGDAAPNLVDVGALMEDLAKHGTSGSRGMQAVSAGLTTLLSGSKSVDAELQTLGVNVFDASGNFVGMGSVIAQLNPVLSQMSDAQRDLAEKTLFGSGAAQTMGQVILGGISQYDAATAAVSKVGSAQEAAEKQAETFHGELETLASTAEDTGTKLGLALLPVLNDIGKGMADVIGFFRENEAAAIALGVVIGGPLVVAMGAFAVSVASKVVGSIVDANVAVVKLGAGLLGLGGDAETAAGTVTAAMTRIDSGASVASAGTQTVLSDVGASVEAMTLQFTGAADTIATSFGTIDDTMAGLLTQLAATDTAITTMAADYTALGASIEATSAGMVIDTDAAAASNDALGLSMRALGDDGELAAAGEEAAGFGLDSMLGPLGLVAAGVTILMTLFRNSGSAAKTAGQNYANDFVSALTLSKGTVQQQETVLQGQIDKLKATDTALQSVGNTVTGVNTKTGLYTGLSKDNQKQLDSNTGTIDTYETQLAKLKQTTDATTAATTAITGVQESAMTHAQYLTRDTAGLAGAVAQLTTDTNNANNALGNLVGTLISANQDQDNWQASIVQAIDAAKGLGTATTTVTGTININTAAGLQARTALDGMSQSTLTTIQSMIKQHDTTQQIDGVLATHVTQMEGVGKAYGLTTGQVDTYLGTLKLTPGQVNTLIATSGIPTAEANIAGFQADINALSGKLVTVTVEGALISNANVATSLGGAGGAAGAQPIAGGAAATGAKIGPGFVTNGASVIVGEGNPTKPEFVIPTDETYRSNAYALTAELISYIGMPTLAGGGQLSASGPAFTGADYTGLAVTGAAHPASLTINANFEAPSTWPDVQGMIDSDAAAIGSAAFAQLQATIASLGLGGPTGGSGGYPSLTSWLGVPYLWGGGHGVSEAVARRLGVDCSGLVDQLYGIAGNTGTQIGMGNPVPNMGQSMPGDLVFFGTSLAVGEPHHVGIITAPGGGSMIDAPHTGTVVRYDNPLGFGSIDGIRRLGPTAPNLPHAGDIATGSITNPTQAALALLAGLGDPQTNASVSSLTTWANAEGGAFHNTAAFNPWNTTMREPGSTAMNSVGVQRYTSWPEGIDATIATLRNGHYPQILADLASGAGLSSRDNPNLTTWGTGPIFGDSNTHGAMARGGVIGRYDQGGIVPPGPSLMLNNTGSNEQLRVITPDGAGRVQPVQITVAAGAVQVSLVSAGTGGAATSTAELRLLVEDAFTSMLEDLGQLVSAGNPGGVPR